MEINAQSEILHTILSSDPDVEEIYLSFLLSWENCVATVELRWSCDEPDRRQLSVNYDMKGDWHLLK